MDTNNVSFPLFSVCGIELEYMIVNRETLNVMPIADQLIYEMANEYCNEVKLGPISCSNEFALHIIELKTNDPSKDLNITVNNFQENIHKINKLLQSFNA